MLVFSGALEKCFCHFRICNLIFLSYQIKYKFKNLLAIMKTEIKCFSISLNFVGMDMSSMFHFTIKHRGFDLFLKLSAFHNLSSACDFLLSFSLTLLWPSWDLARHHISYNVTMDGWIKAESDSCKFDLQLSSFQFFASQNFVNSEHLPVWKKTQSTLMPMYILANRCLHLGMICYVLPLLTSRSHRVLLIV